MKLFKRKWVWIVVAVLVLAGIGGIVGNDNDRTKPNGTDLSASSSISDSLTIGPAESPAIASDGPRTPEPNNTAQESSVAPVASQAVAEPVTASGTLKVSYIDVGQADSFFIELPNNQTMLIDAGNNADGNDVVRYIEQQGYDRIDYLVGTHPHEDHIGGMDTVINDLDIGSIYMPKTSTNTQTFEDVLTAIQNKGLTITSAKAGVSIIDTTDLKISILAPNNSGYDDLNNYSAVVKLVYRDASFLFMGDAEEISENEITADVNIDVLKVGHHGSNSSTSSDFLSKVSPIYTVISVGEGNTYGHPTQETLDKLQNTGTTVYRTDLNGTITISTSGNGYNIETQKNETVTPVSMPTPSVEPSQVPVETPSSAPVVTTTVYITKTGEKYHLDGCRYLKSSKIAISLSDAKAGGYEPCSVCNPPT